MFSGIILYTILCCIVFYYITLYYIMLHYITLYYIILHYIILYYETIIKDSNTRLGPGRKRSEVPRKNLVLSGLPPPPPLKLDFGFRVGNPYIQRFCSPPSPEVPSSLPSFVILGPCRKLDSPSNTWEVAYETSEKRVYGTMQGMCHLSRGNIAQGLSMKTNTNTKTRSEANALIRPHL